MKKLQEKIKKMDSKTILMIAIPIILVLLLILVLVKKKESSIDNNGNKIEAFVPNSEENLVADNKVEAYNSEKQAERLKQKQAEESIVKNSDFFKEVSGEKESEKIRKGENIEDYYDRVVVDKNKNSTTSNKNEQYAQNYRSNNTSNKKVFADNEQDDAVMDSYKKATNIPNKTSIKKEKVEEQTITNKNENNSLSSRLSAKKKEEKQYSEIDENNPQLYNRSRRRASNSTASSSNLIKACIHGDQSVSNGDNVKMRLLEDIQINGKDVAKNTIFYGIAQIQAERLSIKVTAMKLDNNNIEPVKFTIFDNDAIQGLNLPDNTKQELAKQAKNAGADQVNVSSGGIIGSVVSSGVGVAKQVFKKENSQIKVYLKTNYQLFIKEN